MNSASSSIERATVCGITAAVLLLFFSFSPAPAAAADPPGPNADPAAAQALFYEARNLMKAGNYALACPKLEESLRLDYGIGTEFNLADCNEKVGKIATAWSGFVNVAAAAKAQNEPAREKVARERAAALEPRLPRLAVDVGAGGAPGLEVKRDGVVLAPPTWGTAIPVDPGLHRITASAPGRDRWEGNVTAAEGRIARIAIPRLPNAPVVAAPRAPIPADPTPPRPAPTPFPEPIVEGSSTQRTVGWVVGAAGLVGLGIGAGFGVDSLQKREHAKDHCNGNVCDAEGVSFRDKAITSGDVATVASIAGGAALLGGLVLVLTAPRGGPRKEAPATAFRALPQVATNGGGLTLQGVLP